MLKDKTIIAISSAIGKGAIGIIRISGTLSKFIINNLLKDNFDIKSHVIYHKKLIDKENNEIIDDVMLVFMASPRSYTGEDMAEIYCHNNIHIMEKIINLAYKCGASLAKPGEFTERAFLNGKMDLASAESVLDVINANNNFSLKIAQKTLHGSLSKLINDIKTKIIDKTSFIELIIDHEGILDINYKDLKIFFNNIKNDILEHIKISDKTNKISKGIKIALVGKPNVGKSSILNKILGKERAITSDIPGTTRDIIETSIEYKDILFNIFDTAGIRNFDNLSDENILENLGIEKTKEALKIFDYIIFILDMSKKLDNLDLEIIKELKLLNSPNILVVANKKDIKSDQFDINIKNIKSDIFKTSNFFDIFLNKKLIEISAKSDNNIDFLLDKIIENLYPSDNFLNETFMLNSRHKEIFNKIIKNLDILISDIEKIEPLEILSMDSRIIINLLDDILGKNTIINDDILNNIFSKFCIGK